MTRAWLLAATALSVASCGDGGAAFDIVVREFAMGDGCLPRPSISGFVIDVDQGGVNQCIKGICTRPGPEPIDCLEGIETPEVDPGETVGVRVGFYSSGLTLVACASGMEPNIDDGDTITLGLRCGPPLAPCRTTIPADPICPMLDP